MAEAELFRGDEAVERVLVVVEEEQRRFTREIPLELGPKETSACGSKPFGGSP